MRYLRGLFLGTIIIKLLFFCEVALSQDSQIPLHEEKVGESADTKPKQIAVIGTSLVLMKGIP